MELNQMRIFDLVAKRLNITSAAKELQMSQPGVSLQLKYLEEEFGTKLYKRATRGIELTRRGQRFLDAIRPVLSEFQKVELQFKNSNVQKKSSVLVIGGSNTLSVSVLPTIMSEVIKSFPDIQFVVKTTTSAKIESAIESSEIEIGLITSPHYLLNCAYEPYQEHRAVAFVSPQHFLSGKTLTLEELARYPLIVRRASACVEAIQKRTRGPINLAAQFDSPESVKVAVSQRLGVGVLFASRVQSELDKGELASVYIPELDDITVQSFIMYDQRQPLSALAEGFLKTLRRVKTPTQS